MDFTTTDYDKLGESTAIIRYILNNYRRGELNLIKIIGLPGRGKSYASLRLAELLSVAIHKKNEITTRNVVDNILDLLKFVKNIKKPGEILIIEEAEVLFHARRFMSGDNVDANKIFDTIRKKRIICIMNLPLSKSVDSHLTAMCNLQIETISLLKKKGVCIIKPLGLQTNPALSKVYFRKLYEGGKEVDFCILKKPSDELCYQYEHMKDKFMDELYDNMYRAQQKKKEKRDKEMGLIPAVEMVRPLTTKELQIYDLHMKGVRKIDIARQLGKDPSTITQMYANLQKKLKIINKNELFTKKNSPLEPETTTVPA